MYLYLYVIWLQNLRLCTFTSKSFNLWLSFWLVPFQYHENGFAVIENFLSEDEANELKQAGLELCKDAPEKDRKTFHTQDNRHHKDTYFLESANKIGYFYENGALDDNGNFLMEKIYALNKVCMKQTFE